MNKNLKKAIVDFIIENDKDFQLVNNTTANFKAYIYDSSGEYLIGGKEIHDFVRKAIDLLTKD